MMRPLPERLEAVRRALLTLHKALVDSERVTYEATIGPIQSPNHFLQLLTRDPWFAWLQPLSQLIVSMDEALEDEEEPLTSTTLDAVLKQTRALLTPAETGQAFPRHYFEALQRDPNVVMEHGQVVKLLAAEKH